MRSQSGRMREMVATLNDVIEQTYYFEQKVFEWTKKVKDNKAKINKAMGRKESIIVVVDDSTEFKATKNVTTNIDFFPDKLKTTLSKELYDKVIDKTVVINDLENLVKMLKSYGVPPKEFKNFISVSTKVNVDNVDNIIEMGEINIEDIQGCYSASFEGDIKVFKTK